MSKDYCTGFFETWIRWKTFYSWELFDLSVLCEEHDKKCDNEQFIQNLFKHNVVGAIPIGIVASIACLFQLVIKLVKKD